MQGKWQSKDRFFYKKSFSCTRGERVIRSTSQDVMKYFKNIAVWLSLFWINRAKVQYKIHCESLSFDEEDVTVWHASIETVMTKPFGIVTSTTTPIFSVFGLIQWDIVLLDFTSRSFAVGQDRLTRKEEICALELLTEPVWTITSTMKSMNIAFHIPFISPVLKLLFEL